MSETKTNSTATVKATEPPKKPKHRSPNHPMVGLEKAIEMTGKIRGKYGLHEVPVSMAHSECGYKAGSGIADQAVAALKAYGLITISGAGDQRKIKVSAEGDRIVRNAPDRPELIKKAAIAPAVHKELVTHYGDKGLPNDVLLRQYLVWDRPEGQRFNEDTVDAFIARFRAALSFSGIESSDIIEGGSTGCEDRGGEISVGSFVQWNSGGVLQFFTPKQVIGLSEDGLFAFFEDNSTGVEVAELELAEAPEAIEQAKIVRPKATASAHPANPFFKAPSERIVPPADGFAIERTTLDEGAVELNLPRKLSSASVDDFEYWIKGVIRRLRRNAGMKSEAVSSGDDDDLGNL